MKQRPKLGDAVCGIWHGRPFTGTVIDVDRDSVSVATTEALDAYGHRTRKLVLLGDERNVLRPFTPPTTDVQQAKFVRRVQYDTLRAAADILVRAAHTSEHYLAGADIQKWINVTATTLGTRKPCP